MSIQIEVLLLNGLLAQRIEQKIGHIVGQRSADEELHREVVEAFRVLALVGLLRQYPSLRENIPHRAGNRLKAIARRRRRHIDHLVKEEMTFIQRIARPR